MLHFVNRNKTLITLAFILLPTLLVWQGVRFSGFTPDDYFVIDIQSPISSFADAISMLWRVDPNPQYWRPLTNSTVSIDFWLWGWNGGMFHVTNLLLHLIATTLVYFFVLRIFGLQEYIAAGVALFFGIAASHDANMLWIAARSDVIATINMLVMLLASYKAQATSKMHWRMLSWLFFLLALGSKEVSGLAIVLLPLLVWTDSPRELWRERKRILVNITPYFLVAILFLFIRLQFTVPLGEMQPLAAEGSRSPVAFIKNALYSIGYIVAPLGFETASAILNRYLTYGFIAASALLIAVVVLFWKVGKPEITALLYKPVVLVIVTGIVSFQSFERWRVYFPSVGVFAIIALLVMTFWNVTAWQAVARGIAAALIIALFAFNISQALTKQQVWARATEMIGNFKDDYEQLLSRHPERPITLNVITSPIKLGEAQLLQLSTSYLPRMAEAERKKEPLLAMGSLGGAKEEIGYISNVTIYALDPSKGFDGLVTEVRDSILRLTMTPNAKLAFAPNIPITNGVAIRDRRYAPGTSYNTGGATITVNASEGAFIKDATIRINETAGLAVYFDGKHIRELK